MAAENLSAFIWSIADLLRDNYKKSNYGRIILPFTVLRRIDCILETMQGTKVEKRLVKNREHKGSNYFLLDEPQKFDFSTSYVSLKTLVSNSNETSIGKNIQGYIHSFCPSVREIFEKFDFKNQINDLSESKLLYLITKRFTQIDLNPINISNIEMGMIFEELIRKFSESSNETSGEHFTPKGVVRLMVNLLFLNDQEALTKSKIVRNLYDPAIGTGGMLSAATEYLHKINPTAQFLVSGQEINPESYAICKADMLIKGQDINKIFLGNTLSHDYQNGELHDYMLSNPPFGVDWKKSQKEVTEEHKEKGFLGRFGPGLPRVSDGSLLFLLHLVSKMRPTLQGGSRVGIVLNGSPMFTGAAGSGESEIRRYLFENDLIETIVQLPQELFYNTSISTYIWILTNKKTCARKGKVQLIDASSFSSKLSRSIGNKRQELGNEHILEVTKIFEAFNEFYKDEKLICKIFNNEEFGYRSITIDRPERNAHGEILINKDGAPKADRTLREIETIPFSEELDSYIEQEILPCYDDAWVDKDKVKIGYEILFNRYFYNFKKPKSITTINQELRDLNNLITQLTDKVVL
mgnify:CR=1 FL=1